MRWMTPPRDQRERGATSVLVGIMMVGLVGFTGLAVDGGATYAKHQELQNGADAAALAAAQECADNEAECNSADLQTAVGGYGEANVRNEKDSVSASFAPDVADQEVAATVSGTKSHWFLPVVGLSESELSTDATATWGSPTSGPATLPLTISECEFANSLGDPILGTVLDVHMPKNGQDAECGWGSDFPPGGFGWLTNGGCDVEVTVDEWVEGDPGVDPPNDCDWESFIGEVVLVPIFNEYDGTGSSGKYYVTRFAALEVLGIKYKNGGGQVGEACVTDPDPSTKYHNICIRGRFVEYVSTADGYETGGPKTEVSVVKLID